MPTLASRLSALTGTLILAAAAHAGPTALALMPIADVLRHREAVFELSLAGTERNVSKAVEHSHALTVGLFDRVEVGYDHDFMGHWEGNAKLLLSENRLGAVSVGCTGIGSGTLDPYVVGRFDGKGYRLHAGCWHTMDAYRLMLGSDFPVAQSLVGSIEMLSGKGGSSWGALTYLFPKLPGLELTLAVGEPFRHSGGLQYEAALAYGFKL